MARRVFIGSDGGRVKAAVSQAGFDALSADLNQLLFHSDHIPVRPILSGTTVVNKGLLNQADMYAGKVVNVPHALGFAPEVFALATCGDFRYYREGFNTGGPVFVGSDTYQAGLNGKYVTPWGHLGRSPFGVHPTGHVCQWRGGWFFESQVNNLKITNWGYCDITVIWAMFDRSF